MKCLMHTTHSDSPASWGEDCVAVGGEEVGRVWEGGVSAGVEEVAAARRSGLRFMCSLRASMEASLTRAARSAPLEGEGERERERQRECAIRVGNAE